MKQATTVLANAFTASNSVQAGGIHAAPNQTTGGNGPLSGIEVLIDVMSFAAMELDTDHYFFVPQVALGMGDFDWLSSTRPIVATGAPSRRGVAVGRVECATQVTELIGRWTRPCAGLFA
jgi:hypothetical protein